MGFVLAEISDKMGSPAETIIACVVAAAVCMAIASSGCRAALSTLLVALIGGGFFAFAAFHAAFEEGSLSDEVWNELGCRWVVVNIAGPLLPSLGVACVMLFRHSRVKICEGETQAHF
jgi:hypothetical protein